MRPDWLGSDWTWSTTTAGVDVITGPVVTFEGGRTWQQVIEVSVNVARPGEVLMVAGGLRDGQPDDWPDVTRHYTFGTLLAELREYTVEVHEGEDEPYDPEYEAFQAEQDAEVNALRAERGLRAL